MGMTSRRQNLLRQIRSVFYSSFNIDVEWCRKRRVPSFYLCSESISDGRFAAMADLASQGDFAGGYCPLTVSLDRPPTRILEKADRPAALFRYSPLPPMQAWPLPAQVLPPRTLHSHPVSNRVCEFSLAFRPRSRLHSYLIVYSRSLTHADYRNVGRRRAVALRRLTRLTRANSGRCDSMEQLTERSTERHYTRT